MSLVSDNKSARGAKVFAFGKKSARRAGTAALRAAAFAPRAPKKYKLTEKQKPEGSMNCLRV